MNAKFLRCAALAIILLAVAFVATSAAVVTPAAAAPSAAPQRWLIDTGSALSHTQLSEDIVKAGGTIISNHPEINMMVVIAPAGTFRTTLLKNPRVVSMAPDRVEHLIRPEMQEELWGKVPLDAQGRPRVQIDGSKIAAPAPKAPQALTGDPAFTYAGLMWNVNRINAVAAWNQPLGYGFQSIKVAVMDTGLDYTHVELAKKVDGVVDFTVNEQPNICETYYFGGHTDEYYAALFGVPSNLDFNGHGTWIGGNIAAAYDGAGINGIAPGIQLVSLKISQNCGSAWDSTMIDALMYAANNGIDIVSISFGGYLDRSDPEQDLIYRFWTRTVQYARGKGTTIVAAAGNEHTRIGPGGQVISHGILDVPPGGTDYFGLWENPAGIPGVIMVSATGNVVNAASSTCPVDPDSTGVHAWCKPTSDPHQPFGVGKLNQLTYYSNYGPRIDFAAPGGARKFNVPSADRGGSEGWPWTGIDSIYGGSSVADGYNAWEDFSITSNWVATASGIPCIVFIGLSGFPDLQCYSTIQGTSMATPHVSAVAALALSTHPELLKNPKALYNFLKKSAIKLKGNTTPAVSKTDTSNMDRTGAACPNGYCHFGTMRISDADAYGHGFIDALRAVTLH